MACGHRRPPARSLESLPLHRWRIRRTCIHRIHRERPRRDLLKRPDAIATCARYTRPSVARYTRVPAAPISETGAATTARTGVAAQPVCDSSRWPRCTGACSGLNQLDQPGCALPVEAENGFQLVSARGYALDQKLSDLSRCSGYLELELLAATRCRLHHFLRPLQTTRRVARLRPLTGLIEDLDHPARGPPEVP